MMMTCSFLLIGVIVGNVEVLELVHTGDQHTTNVSTAQLWGASPPSIPMSVDLLQDTPCRPCL